MRQLRSRLPAGARNQARLAALAVGFLGAGSQLLQLGNAGRSEGYVQLSGASIAALLAILILTHWRGSSSWWTVPVVPVLVVLGGSGLKDPLATTGLALGAAAVFSQYGGSAQWLTRLATLTVAIPSAVAISPDSAGRVVTWHEGVVLNLLPQLILMGALARGICLALRRQERDMARESALARGGLAMVGITDVKRIRQIGREVGEQIVRLNPGIAMIIIRRDADGLYLSNVAGAPEDLRYRRLDPAIVTDRDMLRSLLPEYRAWEVLHIGEVYIVVAGLRSVPPDVLDAFRNLSNQVILAENGCLAHAELEHSAHHDHLTQLPNRGKFLRAAAEAVATGRPGTVALLNIDLDDFKQVNDTHGHAAGDELLIEIAARLTRHGGGLAGRFGGDEFALLLTGVTDPAAADELAATLSAHLTAPVHLGSGATVTVGASIGVAVTGPGETLAELSRRADIAMYSAKAQRKTAVPA
ncbi:GGDEF domain-containing protein [Actinoplanes bogorensis]|uniref:GGDEF domain-containing protein n=1 Tax=Paractinoplanes bogorensis TaxID=1610840 RepID=A0ABS5YHD8_9ACTN|nr:GGDEF domain-containing protein [Actinoplanes bogorensis]MBU2662761.1 GGDEF domain-containing protein [Actinoplanes bogorensis]